MGSALFCLATFSANLASGQDFVVDGDSAAIGGVGLTLQSAQRIARERSPLMRLSRARFEEKDASFEIARRGPMPKLVSTMGYLYQSNPNGLADLLNKESNGVRSGSDSESLDSTQVRNTVKIDKNVTIIGIGATQILYAGGYFDARQDLADKEREISRLEAKLTEAEIDTLVREIFVGIMFLEQKYRLNIAKVGALRARSEAMRIAAEAKSVSDVLAGESEIQWMAAVRAADETAGELELRRSQLNAVLGRKSDAPVKLVFENKEASDQQLKEPFEAVLSRNPKIGKGLKQISMAESYVRVVKSQDMFVPKAFAFGGVDHLKGVGNSARFLNWSLGFGVVVPLSDGGVQGEETRKALALRSQAESSYEIEEAKLRQEVREAELKIKQSKSDIQLATKASEIAKRTFQEAERASVAKQLPKYKLEESRAASIEGEINVVMAKAQLVKWRSVLSGLIGDVQ